MAQASAMFRQVIIGLALILATFKSSAEQALWQPDECDRKTFLKYNGCDRTVWQEQRFRCNRIRELIREKYNLPALADDVPPQAPEDPTCVSDLMLSKEQSQSLIDKLEQDVRSNDPRRARRRRRKRTALRESIFEKWNNQRIDYKVDGNIVGDDYTTVTDAIRTWESKTCLTFVAHNITENFDDNHLLFFWLPYPICSSYIGKVNLKPQQIYLGFGCYYMGIVAHEIGHALGLIHEHQRPDRDEYISIQYDNAMSADIFFTFDNNSVDTTGLPYDYGSDMEYKSLAFSKNGLPTILTRNELYQSTIGQRQELSFWDVFNINYLYCRNICKDVYLARPCSNHGYQDPKQCNICRCPDGFGGQFCDEVARSVNGIKRKPPRCHFNSANFDAILRF